jgi:glycosyltransferase involved in cell wall biosynthesis
LKIAQVAPLYERVPPVFYGGTERVVSFLTEALVRDGHDVTLFASSDSITSARLVGACRGALRLDPRVEDPVAHHTILLDLVARHAGEFDLVHFHTGYLHFPLSRQLGEPNVTTLHGRLNIPDLADVYENFPDMPLVSISDSQRGPLPWANWQATVHHGLPEDLFPFQARPGEYLAFVGRTSPEKRPDRAIEIAQRAGMRLKMAAKVDTADRSYFESRIRPLLSRPGIDFVGEIGERDKAEFLGRARALLFPIDWPEPFGLVMIEALACGTPVIAFRNGSVPEIVEHGISGYIVESVEEAVDAVGRLDRIDRGACRRAFEKRFTASRMAREYLEVYRRVLANFGGAGREATG